MSSRSLIHRLTPYFAARIRHNHRLLSALPETQSSSETPPSPSQSLDAVHLTDSFVRRMKELQADEAKGKMLRLSIEAGGCSGFQYNFMLDDKSNADDRVFERDGVKLVVDKISLDFVKGATVDYVEELIRSAFQVGSPNYNTLENVCLRDYLLYNTNGLDGNFTSLKRSGGLRALGEGIHKSKCSWGV